MGTSGALISRVSERTIRRFRDAVKEITRYTFTDEVAAFTALAGLIRGWGNYYKKTWFRDIAAEDLAALDLEYILQAWDTASSALGDWSVCVTGGILGNAVYILDVFRARLETPDLLRAVKEQGVTWAPRMILVEDAASGVAVQQMLRRETRLPVLPVPPYKGGKLSHAQANTPYVEGGRVVFCPGRWLTDFEHELLAFPAGTHDDQVDALNILLTRIFQAALKRASSTDGSGRVSVLAEGPTPARRAGSAKAQRCSSKRSSPARARSTAAAGQSIGFGTDTAASCGVQYWATSRADGLLARARRASHAGRQLYWAL